MTAGRRPRRRARRTALAALAIALAGTIGGLAAAGGGRQAAPAGPATGPVTLRATFDDGVSPLRPQCAPDTPSKPPRLRGYYEIDRTIVGQGDGALRITLPIDHDRARYPLEVCDMHTGYRPIRLGTDGYYGIMIYRPVVWTIPNAGFYGVGVYELHFQDIYGAPVTLQVHLDHVTIAIESGACESHLTAHPGCTWRSNADAPPGGHPTLPGYYAIPPGALAAGRWNEIILRVRWSRTKTGLIQSWYRTKGARAWRRGSSVAGIPTVQWDRRRGCCEATADDQIEAYASGVSSPFSIWLDNVVEATSLRAAQALMP